MWTEEKMNPVFFAPGDVIVPPPGARIWRELQPNRSLPSIVSACLEKVSVQAGKRGNPALRQDVHRPTSFSSQ